MRTFTDRRLASTVDELWLLEHPPVFTQGLAGKPEHVLKPATIPIIRTDRGGQVTYHGPGQLMLYFLLDIRRLMLHSRTLVHKIEAMLIDYLQCKHEIHAYALTHAPGIYVDHAKMGAIGLRIRRGYCYHGLAFNINMDLNPFTYINPCGFPGLQVTQLSHYKPGASVQQVAEAITPYFVQHFGYTDPLIESPHTQDIQYVS